MSVWEFLSTVQNHGVCFFLDKDWILCRFVYPNSLMYCPELDFSSFVLVFFWIFFLFYLGVLINYYCCCSILAYLFCTARAQDSTLLMMGCFSCFVARRKDARKIEHDNGVGSADSSGNQTKKPLTDGKCSAGSYSRGKAARSFTFRELAAATGNFRASNLLGEGGFGKVYKGRLESGQFVAVKLLNQEGFQGSQEFIIEVLMLSVLHHPNLVTLIGYCTDGDQRLLVYEYMSMGSLDDHLFDVEPSKEPLDWNARIKIAAGAARGLEYLHCKANPPVIYRDLKSANILMDYNFNSKLSDFGLAKLGPVGDNTHVSTRVMGTYGYCAPEYAMSGHLTLKSDIFSFGVVLLELITGRKAYDTTKKPGEQNLVSWSIPHLKDPRKFIQYVDPLLCGRYPVRCLNYMIAIAAMCVQEKPSVRPHISDIVEALEYLATQTYNGESHRGDKRSPHVYSFLLLDQYFDD